MCNNVRDGEDIVLQTMPLFIVYFQVQCCTNVHGVTLGDIFRSETLTTGKMNRTDKIMANFSKNRHISDVELNKGVCSTLLSNTYKFITLLR